MLLFSCANEKNDVQFVPRPTQYYNYPNNYRTYNQPSSRFYTNPYKVPPYNYYPYYDYDQYYVPPVGGFGNGYDDNQSTKPYSSPIDMKM